MAREKARKQRRTRARSKQAQHRRRCARVSNADQFRELQRWLLPNNGIFAIFRFHGKRRAVTDSYVRKSSKRARYRPPNPDKKPLGNPEIRKLTPQEQKKLDAITSTKSVA